MAPTSRSDGYRVHVSISRNLGILSTQSARKNPSLLDGRSHLASRTMGLILLLSDISLGDYHFSLMLILFFANPIIRHNGSSDPKSDQKARDLQMAMDQQRCHLLIQAPSKRRNEAARNEHFYAKETRPRSREAQAASCSYSLQEGTVKLHLPTRAERSVPSLSKIPRCSRKDDRIEPHSNSRHYFNRPLLR